MIRKEKCKLCNEEVDVRILRGIVISKRLPLGSVKVDDVEKEVVWEIPILACKNCLYAFRYGGIVRNG